MEKTNVLGPSFYSEFSKEISKYNLQSFQQLGYDEALLSDPLDLGVEMQTPEDAERRKHHLAAMNPYQRMAYRMGRVDRLELRGLYMHPEQSVFDVKSDACKLGWTRHPIRLVTADEHAEWAKECGDRIPVDGYRCIYLGDASSGEILTYINECFSYRDDAQDAWGVAERLCLRVIGMDRTSTVIFEEYMFQLGGYLHRSPEDATAAALKAVFDDWRDSLTETPDERLAKGSTE